MGESFGGVNSSGGCLGKMDDMDINLRIFLKSYKMRAAIPAQKEVKL